MNKLLTKHSDRFEYNANFLAGLCCLEESEYHQAREYFLSAVCESEPSDTHYFIYASYLELSGVLSDYKDGVLPHCCHASETKLPIEPEIQLNLACSEFIKGNRKLAIEAMDKVKGFKLSKRNSKAIDSMYRIIGKRNKDAQGRLVRNNFWRKSLGKILRKNKAIGAERVEGFIKDNVRNRYHYSSVNLI